MPSSVVRQAGRSWTAGICQIPFLCRARGDTMRARCYKTEATGRNLRYVTGLYGYDVLKSATGFQAFAQSAIEKAEELIDRIRQMPPSMDTIRLFDELSDTVCTVVDSAELCRNTHTDMEFVKEASQASLTMYEYLHRLNSNTILYDAILRVEQLDVLTTEEAKRAAQTLRVEFERGGIHLPEEKLGRVHNLNLQITHLGREFVANILKDPGHVDIFPASKVPKCIQKMTKPIFRSKNGTTASLANGDMGMNGFQSGVRVITEAESLSSILNLARDREVRKQAYIEAYSVPKANLRVLDNLIAARHELAEILGYESFAEFTVAPTMAGCAAVVESFLFDMSAKIRGKADEELNLLEKFGRAREGSSFDNVGAWDIAFYSGSLKTEALGLNASVVASYFPLAQCIEGLKLITKSLFDMVLKEVPLVHGEAWHPDVQKFILYHSLEGEIGHLYLDLYARNGKFPGSAHFAIKGGRRLAENNYQLPVVALVCNFSSPHMGSSPVLNHWEVETLFHEFGHALHSLLTRTDYQHFSGTRTVLDFVETPSNLLEYYAWDYRVLRRFTKHYVTGEVIPNKLVEAMNKAKNMFAATELQKQVLYAIIDQKFFGKQPLSADSTFVIASLKHQHTSWKHVEGTHWHTRFNHLVTYGAGYYSYLYAKCFAATIWHSVCMVDPLSSEAGETLRKNLLEHGGGKDPAAMIKDCAGEEALLSCSKGGVKPACECLYQELGL